MQVDLSNLTIAMSRMKDWVMYPVDTPLTRKSVPTGSTSIKLPARPNTNTSPPIDRKYEISQTFDNRTGATINDQGHDPGQYLHHRNDPAVVALVGHIRDIRIQSGVSLPPTAVGCTWR